MSDALDVREISREEFLALVRGDVVPAGVYRIVDGLRRDVSLPPRAAVEDIDGWRHSV